MLEHTISGRTIGRPRLAAAYNNLEDLKSSTRFVLNHSPNQLCASIATELMTMEIRLTAEIMWTPRHASYQLTLRTLLY